MRDLREFYSQWVEFTREVGEVCSRHGPDLTYPFGASTEYRNACVAAAARREWLRSRLETLRRRIPALVGTPQFRRAEEELMAFSFRGDTPQFLEQFRDPTWLKGFPLAALMSPFNPHKAREVAANVKVALEAAIYRLDEEVEELYEELRRPGDRPYRSTT